ncbi:MAG: Hint domain-containing homing endonuclease [Candidatus Helarchaeota archaeon]
MIGDPILVSQKDYTRVNVIIPEILKTNIVLIGGGSGTNKCFAKGTEILMFDGSVKNVEDIKIGDKLLGIDGSERNVINYHTGKDTMFEIIPNRGNNFIVNSEHLLYLTRKIYNKHKPYNFIKEETKIISVKDWFKLPKREKIQYKLKKASCLKFKEKKVPIDSYFLGLWLGDGRNDEQTITNIDKEVITYIKNYAKKLKLKFSEYNHGQKCSSYSIVQTNRSKQNILRESLFKLNLYNNKHIPNIYKLNSRKNRLELLAGLLDSDGCYQKKANTFLFSNSSKTLIKDVLWLARSLGFYCSKSSFFNKKYKKTYYVVYISGNLNTIPTKIKRKKAKERKINKNHLVTGFKIKKLKNDRYYGFEVDKDSLFLLKDFTIVHNSELSYAIQKKLWNKNKSSFVISLDDYYLIHATIRATNRKKLGLNSVGLNEIEWETLKRIYEDFQNKITINFKRTHRFLETIEHNAIDSKDIDYLIVEGLYANYLRKFYNNNFSVYLEGSPSQTLKFRKMRGKEDEHDEFRIKVVQKEYNVVCQLQRYADVKLPYIEE